MLAKDFYLNLSLQGIVRYNESNCNGNKLYYF
jgi:hypothetical protein